MPRVIYCERPTVTEAWATVLGLPAPFVAEEGPSLVFAARKRLPGAQVEPAVVVADIQPQQPVPPFWNHQVSWNDRRFLARIGHRFLSVHLLASATAAYETYDESFLPGLDPWLRVFEDIYSDELVRHRVDRIAYGYVNRFIYPAEGFDLSQRFKLSVGVDVQSASEGLSTLVVGFSFLDPSGAATVAQVTMASDPGDLDSVVVTTKVSTEIGSPAGTFLDSPSSITDQIVRAKEIAKRAFFELATDATHEQLGARYAAH